MDEDVLILKQVIYYARAGRDVVVVAKDTDKLALIMSNRKVSFRDMVIAIEKKLKKKASKKLSPWRVYTLID